MIQHRVEVAVWASTAVAWLTVTNAAFLLTVIATIISISLGLMRWYDRIKYGPRIND